MRAPLLVTTPAAVFITGSQSGVVVRARSLHDSSCVDLRQSWIHAGRYGLLVAAAWEISGTDRAWKA
jgi:hypothetical protein